MTEFLLWSQVLTEGNRKVLTEVKSRNSVNGEVHTAVLTLLLPSTFTIISSINIRKC